jgi:tartrate dehydratase alpha subunit/fumarate hydratase class I-like protein
MYDAKLRFS